MTAGGGGTLPVLSALSFWRESECCVCAGRNYVNTTRILQVIPPFPLVVAREKKSGHGGDFPQIKSSRAGNKRGAEGRRGKWVTRRVLYLDRGKVKLEAELALTLPSTKEEGGDHTIFWVVVACVTASSLESCSYYEVLFKYSIPFWQKQRNCILGVQGLEMDAFVALQS